MKSGKTVVWGGKTCSVGIFHFAKEHKFIYIYIKKQFIMYMGHLVIPQCNANHFKMHMHKKYRFPCSLTKEAEI